MEGGDAKRDRSNLFRQRRSPRQESVYLDAGNGLGVTAIALSLPQAPPSAVRPGDSRGEGRRRHGNPWFFEMSRFGVIESPRWTGVSSTPREGRSTAGRIVAPGFIDMHAHSDLHSARGRPRKARFARASPRKFSAKIRQEDPPREKAPPPRLLAVARRCRGRRSAATSTHSRRRKSQRTSPATLGSARFLVVSRETRWNARRRSSSRS